MRECVKDSLEAIGEDPSVYGLHSFRAGAATASANAPGVSSHLWARHGGWAPESGAKDGYVELDEDVALRVPRVLAV